MSGPQNPFSVQLVNQMSAFLNFCRLEKGLADNSLEAYSADLSRFTSFFQGSGRIPGTEDLRNYLDHLSQTGLGSRSIARHLTTLRSLYGFLLREGRVSTDPTEHTCTRKIARHTRHHC